MADHVVPNSPFTLHASLDGAEQQSRLGAYRWIEWLQVVFASSPGLFVQLRQHLVQESSQRGGYTLVYTAVSIRNLIAVLQRGEQIEDTVSFQVGELCDSSILLRPDLLPALPSDRSRVVFIVNILSKDENHTCLIVSTRPANFLQILQNDKYTGFEPWKTIRITRQDRGSARCQYCGITVYKGHEFRCMTCGCGVYCSLRCSRLFSESFSHAQFCRNLRYLTSGYHTSIA